MRHIVSSLSASLSSILLLLLWAALILTSYGVVLLLKMFAGRKSSSRTMTRLPYFSGPWGLPLIGNVQQVCAKQQWLQYTDWHQIYGPIFSLNFAGQPVLVVGNAQMASDLMDRRGAIYSDRPRFIMAAEILTGGMNLAFASPGARWKRMRKAANVGLSAKAAEEYTLLQEQEAGHLIRGLMTSNGEIDEHIRRTSASAILSVVYATPPLPPVSSKAEGLRLKGSEAATLLTKVENYVSRMLKAALPGNYLVDFFPWMMYIPSWVPGASWKREGHEWYRKDTDMFLGLMQGTKIALKSGNYKECFATKLIECSAQHGLDPVESAWLAGTMFGAGTEALAATLSFFILAMLLHPHVQDKLRAEIDNVVGNPEDPENIARPPTFQDTRRMPYLHAVIKEVMRWRPMGPLGVPHRSVEDDVYNGHFIPAGTLILPNVWAMHHDGAVYSDPHRFLPERFLAEDGVTPIEFPDTRNLGHHGFGFGRRMCPGYYIANNSLAINAANVIWAFYICKAKDGYGREITPNPDDLLDEGLAVRPIPFPCSLEPRSTAIVKVIYQLKDEV